MAATSGVRSGVRQRLLLGWVVRSGRLGRRASTENSSRRCSAVWPALQRRGPARTRCTHLSDERLLRHLGRLSWTADPGHGKTRLANRFANSSIATGGHHRTQLPCPEHESAPGRTPRPPFGVLKIGRSAVRPRPWPPPVVQRQQRRGLGYCPHLAALPQVSDLATERRRSSGPSGLAVGPMRSFVLSASILYYVALFVVGGRGTGSNHACCDAPLGTCPPEVPSGRTASSTTAPSGIDMGEECAGRGHQRITGRPPRSHPGLFRTRTSMLVTWQVPQARTTWRGQTSSAQLPTTSNASCARRRRCRRLNR